MRANPPVMLLGILCILLVIAGVSSAKTAGKGAFLAEYAIDVPQVMDQVDENRLVALRYSKHFHAGPSTLLNYFKQELSLITLDSPSLITVYYLDDSRQIVSEIRQFDAGAKVFANRAGTPLLEFGTGNPLVSTLPVRGAINPAGLESTGQSNIAQQVLNQPPIEMAQLPTLAPAAAATTTTTAISIPASIGGGAGSVLSTLGSRWLIPAGIAGAAIILTNGGSASNTEPIPEPSGLIVLGSGLITFYGVIRRKTRGC